MGKLTMGLDTDKGPPMLTGMQIRMARAALRLKIDDISERANIPWARLQRLEHEDGPTSANEETLENLRAFFAGRGVEFIGGGGDLLPGVALHEDWSRRAAHEERSS